MTKFKICGLREAEHAVAAAEAGASFLGFVFVPGVRRQLTVEKAKAVIEEYRRRRGGDGPRLVGLFADQSDEEVNRIIGECGLDLAQLCGDEPAEYWSGIDAPVFKQIKVRDGGSRHQTVARTLQRVDEVVSAGAVPLLDAYEAGALGGTGRSFDWSVAREVAGRYDVVLAGGLSPENVSDAIATARPWGVDVSSGVESDGVKDLRKIAGFAEAVKRVDRQIGESPSVKGSSN